MASTAGSRKACSSETSLSRLSVKTENNKENKSNESRSSSIYCHIIVKRFRDSSPGSREGATWPLETYCHLTQSAATSTVEKQPATHIKQEGS